jgi:hypothetical protein
VSTSTKIRWAKRVKPQKIRRLYQSDAQGMLDQDLLDDVGYGFYVCCRELLELGEAIRGRIKCRDCGAIIVRQTVDGKFSRDPTELLTCTECSWQVTCGDYHKSLLRIEPGSPELSAEEQLAEVFVQEWPRAGSPRQKLLLIDELIHEFHMHYRAVGSPLGWSVVRATGRQLMELLENLAYGPGTTPGLEETRQVWSAQLKARQMQTTRSELEAAARNLGIKGYSRMRGEDLARAVERADPTYFEAWLNTIKEAERNSD